jgi:hypothetical protein
MVLMTFQFPSTALTVTVNGVPATCAVGVPVLPVGVPGAAVSPGTNNCNFTNPSELTVINGLVLEVFVPSVISLPVTVAVPAVFIITANVCVPLTKAAFTGKAAFGSVAVIPTTSITVLTKFQFASTALTVTINGVPAVCMAGVPVLPVVVPGAAVSPGTRSCNFVNAPTPTVIAGLVLAVFVPSVMSVAVTVRDPTVFKVTLKVFVPATRAALAGNAAFTSLEEIPTWSATVLIRFQFASTALTVTLNGVPATCALGVPVLPVGVPGAAVSPGTKICSFANEPPPTLIDGLVLAVFVPSVISVDVTVAVPAVFRVTANVFVPPTSAALDGNTAFASVDVMPTTSVELTTFQFASTAFTVTLNDAPEACALGVPVLPVGVPGAAVSPGTKICSFANAPPPTLIDGLVFAVFVPSVISVDVTV